MQDLYKLANEIRMKYKKVAFVKGNYVNIMNGTNAIVKLSEGDKLPNMDKIKSMEEYVPDRLKNFDTYLRYIDSSFDDGIIITDMALLLVADRIAETLYIGDCYYYFGVMHVYNKEFTHKLDLYDALPVMKQENPLTLRDLVIKAVQGQYIQGNRAVVLDNIAYVAKSYQVYLDRPEKIDRVAMFGYIHMGEITWMDVNQEVFKEAKAAGDKSIRVLETLDISRIDSVLRCRRATDMLVREYPYPIAILEDNELSYCVKERRKNANILFRKIK